MPVNDIPHCAEGVHRAAARKFSSHGEDDTSPHASTSTSNAMWSSSTSARHVTFERKCQLHVLSPTTEMDVGAADYNTAYSHLLSLEYLFSVGIFAYLHIHGFVLLRRLCEVHNSSFSVLISTPKTIMEYLGSSGYDHNLDVQFYAYCDALWILALLSAALGIATYVCHRLATLSSRTADDSPASSAACSEAFSLSPLVQPIGANTSSSSSTSKSRRTPPKTPVDVALTISRQTSRVKASAACLPPLIYSVVGVIFIAVVHGPHFFLPLLLIAANYVVFTRLQRWCPYWAFMAIMWVVHTGLLYIIELYSGFEETYWLQYLFPTSFESTFNVLGPDFTREGLWRQQMRWCVAFRMTTLRLIAFNYD
ncbi:putative glycerol uptake protein, partial [Leptomonas seymouri]